jgi:demethylmenaquinone methyltransferase/2-methoxy-6-polyprenyl-1,4-benzoquinol methylase
MIGVGLMERKKVNPKQRSFFNEKASIWDEICVHDRQKVEYIVQKADIRGDERILDVGTGTGIMIPHYLKHLASGNIVAVDYSENMINMARSKFPEKDWPMLSYVVSDLYDLKYDAAFDIVVCYSCFPHFVDQTLAVEILSKALKRGGRLVVAHSDSAKKINGVHMSGGVEISNDFLPSMATLKRIMADSGLTVGFERDDDAYFICIATKG